MNPVSFSESTTHLFTLFAGVLGVEVVSIWLLFEEFAVGFGLFLQREGIGAGGGGHAVEGDRFLRFARNDSGRVWNDSGTSDGWNRAAEGLGDNL